MERERKRLSELRSTLNELRNVIQKFGPLEEYSPLKTLEEMVSRYQRIGDQDLVNQNKLLMKNLGKSIFRGVIDEYERRLRNCPVSERADISARWQSLQFNKIPLEKKYFTFIMLMLDLFLTTTNANNYTGVEICDAINDFFIDFTSYAEHPISTKIPFGKARSFKETMKTFMDKESEKPTEIKPIQLKSQIVDVLMQDLEFVLQSVTNDLWKITQDLNTILDTPKILQHLTYDRIEALLLHDNKYKSKDQSFISRQVEEEKLDPEVNLIRKTFQRFVECATNANRKCTEKQHKIAVKFFKLRSAYLSIFDELRKYTIVIADKWDVMWNNYKSSTDSTKRNEFCDKLKTLISSFASLMRTCYAHERIPEMFPDIELDLLAYEAFMGQPIQLEDQFTTTFGIGQKRVGQSLASPMPQRPLAQGDYAQGDYQQQKEYVILPFERLLNQTEREILGKLQKHKDEIAIRERDALAKRQKESTLDALRKQFQTGLLKTRNAVEELKQKYRNLVNEYAKETDSRKQKALEDKLDKLHEQNVERIRVLETKFSKFVQDFKTSYKRV